MRTAYVDTSSLVAVAFAEPDHQRELERLGRADRLFSSNLLEAEFRSAVTREGVAEPHEVLLDWISWVLPARELEKEFRTVLAIRHLRGADLWHLACALYLREAVADLSFLSLDRRQVEVARRIGFAASD